MKTKYNSPLLKQIRSGSKYKLVPHKAFLSNSIVESLRKLLNTPGILQLYNTWVNYNTINGTLNDITDGQMWKDFIVYEAQPF